MRKAIYAGGLLAVLVAVVFISQTRASAQNPNRFAIQGDLLSLVGPGSSIGITVRDSDAGVVVERVRTETPASRAGVKEGDIVTEFDGE
jgi:C-terminal processing protease CtpA/Prc